MYNYSQTPIRVVGLALLFISMSITQVAAQQMEATGGDVLPYTPENLITNTFLGAGVQVTDIQYSGVDRAVGFFSGGQASIGIDRGIILSTGVANKVVGKGSDGSQDNNDLNQNFQSEQDLQDIAGNAPLRNVAKYTIKFIPTADTLRFRYVFASEEYPEFVCSEFNDVFGFFISGPGINGSYENGGENIAKIPGTNFPVTINHVNGGTSGAWGSPGNCVEPVGSLNFSHLFNDNQNSNFQPVYDGFTNVFTAQAVVIPCREYTIKLTIADVSDEGYDSGVFLEAKSFGTQQISLASETYSPDGAVTEACADGFIKFKLSEIQNTDYNINYSVFGTAQNGVDFENLPGTLTIPAGDKEAKLTITAFEDNIIEPTEVVYIDVERDMCTRDTVAIYIKDNILEPPVLPNPEICPDNSFFLDGSISIQNSPGQSFESNQLIAISPHSTTKISEIQVSNVFPPILKSGIIESVCLNIDHNNPEDIEAWLVAPNGDFMLLTSDNGTGGADYSNTCFSPDANTYIQNAAAPFTGTFLPEGKWEDLLNNNSESNGTWKLMVRDDEIGSTGVLHGWTLNFKPSYTLDYQWTGGAGIDCPDCPSTDISPIQSSVYELNITDSYGCSVSAESDIEILTKEDAPAVKCDTATYNSVVFEWDSLIDISSYEIQINGGGWQFLDATEINYEINNLGLNESVDFKIRVISDCPGEIGTANCRTLSCTPPVVDFSLEKEVTCFGNSDAEILLSVPGSQDVFDFELNGEINQTGIFTGLQAGSYSAIVKDILGCFSEVEFDVLNPELLNLTTQVSNPISCYEGNDGVAQAFAAGGLPPYDFEWETGETTSTINNLSTGLYTVTATDSNGCMSEEEVILIQPRELTGAITGTKVSCNGAGDGSAVVSPEGGSAPYQIEWNNGTTGQNLRNVSGGIFNVTITDSKNCRFETEIEIEENEPILLSLNSESPKCNGEENGSAQVLASGGTNDFSYRWSTGEYGGILQNLKAGTYMVTATDTDNCATSDEITITDRPVLKANIDDIPASCAELNDGQAELFIQGGTPGYEVIWWDGNKDLVRSDLHAGTYSLQIRDSLNCLLDKSVEITSPAPIQLDFEAVDPTCYEGDSGYISLNTSGGSGDFEYDWGSGFSNLSVLGGLSEGTYSVVVRDKNHCETKQDFLLNRPEKIASEAIVTNVSCFGKRDGSIVASLTGGTGNYAMAWTNQSGSLGPGNKIEFLTAGNYELYANDENGCIFTQTYEIIEPVELTAEHESLPITCTNRRDGEILLEIEGGTLPYEVYLDGSKRGNIEQISDLKKGEYLISVQDANNCVFESETIIVDAEHAFEVSLGKDTLVTYGTMVPIEPKIVSFYNIKEFEWTSTAQELFTCDDCPSTDIHAKKALTVKLKIEDEKGCIAENRMNIFIEKDFKVLVPTGFTPNGDGINDRLLVHGTDGTLVKTFKIFDRWGELVFESGDFYVNDPSGGWAGDFRGKSMNSGVFVWYAETVGEDGSTDLAKGETTLIR